MRRSFRFVDRVMSWENWPTWLVWVFFANAAAAVALNLPGPWIIPTVAWRLIFAVTCFTCGFEVRHREPFRLEPGESLTVTTPDDPAGHKVTVETFALALVAAEEFTQRQAETTA